ncbi:MAG: hypothetical protein OXC37_03915 [Bdellovibrionaceae bacterium]|nr:hypothetical protein [Pseudobdellovibrionaceae bacterium]
MNLLIKNFGILFFLLSSGTSMAQDQISELDEETLSTICADNTISTQSEQICRTEKVDLERIAVCDSYTSSPISEGLCLKKKELSTKIIMNCYLKTKDLLEEKICLLYPDDPNAYNSIAMKINNTETFLTQVKLLQDEIQELLGFNVAFNLGFMTFQFFEANLNTEDACYDESNSDEIKI